MSVEEKTAGHDAITAARAAARLSKSLEVALGDANLSLPQYRLLLFLSGGPERATALAGWLDVSPPSLTALVDGAVNRGLVQRVASLEDRRCVRHEITPEGHRALAEADDDLVAKLTGLLAHLPPSERTKAIDGLRLVGKAIDLNRAANDAAQAQAKTAEPAGAKA